MAYSIITNFDVNTQLPIDSRLIATCSAARLTISGSTPSYVYDGLKVFQTDDRGVYTWNSSSSTWSLDNAGGNGIYGGNGSLQSTTTVDFGTVSSTVGASSSLFRYKAYGTSSNNVFLQTYGYRKGVSTWTGLSFRLMMSNDTTNLSYIEWNPDSSNVGGLAFGTGDGGSYTVSERMRITRDGTVLIGSTGATGSSMVQITGDMSLLRHGATSGTTGSKLNIWADMSPYYSFGRTHPSIGLVTLVSGFQNVYNNNVTANSIIWVQRYFGSSLLTGGYSSYPVSAQSITTGNFSIVSQVPGGGLATTDNSTVQYWIIN
jgi:hypothetical protein